MIRSTNTTSPSCTTLRRIEEEAFRERAQDVCREDIRMVASALYQWNGRTAAPAFHRWVIKTYRLRQLHLRYRDVRADYSALQERLHRHYPDTVRQTESEDRVFRALSGICFLEILRGVWIGHGCVDLFVPGIAGSPSQKPRMRGLAIEVDGPIHDQQAKMNRDTHKIASLFHLRIGCTSVPNERVGSETMHRWTREITSGPMLDTRSRKRLWRDIYIATLIHHGSVREIAAAMGLPLDLVKSLERSVG